MATSRAELRHAIDTQLTLVHGAPEVARVATGGTTSTVVDTAAVEPENYWGQYWLYVAGTTDEGAPQGEESRVTASSARTNTLFLVPALSAAVEAGDSYELRRYFSAAAIHAAIDHAIEAARFSFPHLTLDETLLTVEDATDYTIPGEVDVIHKVALLESDVAYRGIATGGSSETVEDLSRSWAVDSLVGAEIGIYSGTGAGQYRTVDSNTATEVHVATDWVTEPEEGSKYVITDPDPEPPQVIRLTHYDIVGSSLIFPNVLPAGYHLRLTYTPAHTELTTEASVTNVPKTYIVLRACQELLGFAKLVAPEAAWTKLALSVHDRLERTAVDYLIANKRPAPLTTWRNRGGTKRRRWWSAANRTFGSRESD